MNKEYVLYHLREASEALLSMIAEMESDDEYEIGSFKVDLGHVYHHANTAWNAKTATEQRVKDCVEADFKRWRKFPSAQEFSL